MFQTGYLTINNSYETVDGKFFSLKLPNTEVKNSTIRFLMPFAKIKTPKRVNLFCREQAKALVASLSNLDPRVFEAAFGSFLACLPYQIHVAHEAYYHTVLVLALVLADQPYYAEPSTGDGRADLSLRTAAGNVHVVEIKHREAPKTPKGEKPPTAEMIDEALQTMCNEAMTQIDGKRYVWPHLGGGDSVYKTALAVYGRTWVKIELRQADNWTLEETPQGRLVVMRPGGRRP
jgi:hypothetical protein